LKAYSACLVERGKGNNNTAYGVCSLLVRQPRCVPQCACAVAHASTHLNALSTRTTIDKVECDCESDVATQRVVMHMLVIAHLSMTTPNGATSVPPGARTSETGTLHLVRPREYARDRRFFFFLPFHFHTHTGLALEGQIIIAAAHEWVRVCVAIARPLLAPCKSNQRHPLRSVCSLSLCHPDTPLTAASARSRRSCTCSFLHAPLLLAAVAVSPRCTSAHHTSQV
jgi:hypothetical protein